MNSSVKHVVLVEHPDITPIIKKGILICNYKWDIAGLYTVSDLVE